MSQRTEWVIHVWGKKRDTLELTDVEKFHIDMLRMYQEQQKRFDKILINIALDDTSDMDLYDFLVDEINKVITCEYVVFKYCQNDKNMGEYVTFRPYVFDRIGEDVNVFYTHFRGYHTYFLNGRESFPIRVCKINEMFWSYIMYRYSLDLDDVNEKLEDRCFYCWYLLKGIKEGYNLNYYNAYFNILYAGDSRFAGLECDDLCKHSPGSFAWYNLKNIRESLADKPLVTKVATEYLLKQKDDRGTCLCTHFSELYIPRFLDDKDCYSVRDFNQELQKMPNTLYTAIYTSKMIGREYLPDFEKYLIDNELI